MLNSETWKGQQTWPKQYLDCTNRNHSGTLGATSQTIHVHTVTKTYKVPDACLVPQAQVPIYGWLMVIPWCVTLSGCRGRLLRWSNHFLYEDLGLFRLTTVPIVECGQFPSRALREICCWDEKGWHRNKIYSFTDDLIVFRHLSLTHRQTLSAEQDLNQEGGSGPLAGGLYICPEMLESSSFRIADQLPFCWQDVVVVQPVDSIRGKVSWRTKCGKTIRRGLAGSQCWS